ncbi:hypothetical protein TREMEDRAFT_45849 [Tremella mesenterica DSM 1558]|uniref:uncharacterized protein n=1 Tax=Tremella mesenterica (strain ATCC 24925 / CBS 8224 / DSM 1558 / NBRC 9311 / NRRL Y-6157 / RJB 2259-6 / UBC 559-6) TaxID=578456 RepID=UPI00032C7D16|nr:uncharacterized protein TREMEDRAFT_45849 [Tremella mesenterica DSM 1558]EIW66172.1 hypothetical protein TREMEDRAFT_45849 [Tremella mesenterica DSM 1558]
MGSGMSTLGLPPGAVSRLGGVVGFTYAFQSIFAAYAVPAQTEKFYDLVGALGHMSTIVLSLYYPQFRGFLSGKKVTWPAPTSQNFHPRQLLVSAMVLFWAGRLGSFLALRIAKQGSDSRFDEIKKQPLVFTGAWLGQATWITVVTLPAVMLNIMPRSAHPGLGIRDLIGVGIWASGIGLEIIADREKSAWRKSKDEKKHEERFISSGVWSWSRHPNYLGEVILQAGPPVLGLCLPPPARYVGFASPLLSYLLLRYGSGVPILEKKAEEKFANDEKWVQYRKTVGVMFPGLGKGQV